MLTVCFVQATHLCWNVLVMQEMKISFGIDKGESIDDFWLTWVFAICKKIKKHNKVSNHVSVGNIDINTLKLWRYKLTLLGRGGWICPPFFQTSISPFLPPARKPCTIRVKVQIQVFISSLAIFLGWAFKLSLWLIMTVTMSNVDPDLVTCDISWHHYKCQSLKPGIIMEDGGKSNANHGYIERWPKLYPYLHVKLYLN